MEFDDPGDELIRSRGEAVAAADAEKKLEEPARDDPRWTDKLWGMLQRIAAAAMIIMILGRATQLSYQAPPPPPPPTPSLADLDGSWFWSVVGGVAGGGGT